jgi:hypothetical protein
MDAAPTPVATTATTATATTTTTSCSTIISTSGGGGDGGSGGGGGSGGQRGRASQLRESSSSSSAEEEHHHEEEIHFEVDGAAKWAAEERSAQLASEAEHARQVEQDNQAMAVVMVEGGGGGKGTSKGSNVLIATFKAAEEKIAHREAERRRVEYPDVSSKGLWNFMSASHL